MSGPAANGNGARTPRTGRMPSSRGLGIVEKDSRAGGDLVALAGDPARGWRSRPISRRCRSHRSPLFADGMRKLIHRAP